MKTYTQFVLETVELEESAERRAKRDKFIRWLTHLERMGNESKKLEDNRKIHPHLPKDK